MNKIDKGLLITVADAAKSRMSFKATKKVLSDAILCNNKVICVPGDDVEVVRWHCLNGPTEVIVNGRQPRAIPFGWVMEMGAPNDLKDYMPFAPKSWEEILQEA